MNIGIIGCGWLGEPLASTLSKKYQVSCFNRDTTSDTSNFWQSNIIIIAINTKDNYLQTLAKIAKLTQDSSSIILISSTSVYREFNKEIDETVDITDIKRQREAEILLSGLRKNILILRLGGLMGEDRISGKWKSISTFTDGPVNYIHKDDAIGAICFMIENQITTSIYNLVAPEHPLRSNVHKSNCERFGLELGSFEGETFRIVNSDKLLKLGYKFKYPNPLSFWS